MKPFAFFKDKIFMGKNEYPSPAFESNKTAIGLACDTNYLPYVMVLIQNIIEKSSPENTYDIIVETVGIEEEVMEFCLGSIKGLPNFSLRFLDHSYILKSKDMYLSFHGYATYAKLLAPDTFQAYEKVLCLDSDLLIQRDLNLFCEMDLGDNYLSAALDYPLNKVFLEGFHLQFEHPSLGEEVKQGTLSHYYFNYMNFSQDFMINKYFNCGVILFNIKKIREDLVWEEMSNLLDSGKKFWVVDQDFINFVFKEKKFILLDNNWVAYYFKDGGPSRHIDYLSEESLSVLREGRASHPLLYHFLVSKKPWDFLLVNDELSLEYWDIASRSLMYVSVLKNYSDKFQAEALKELRHGKDAVIEKMRVKDLFKKLVKKILKKLFPENSFLGKRLRKIKRLRK